MIYLIFFILLMNAIYIFCRERETQFFSSHPVFRNCDPSVYGVDQLSKKLTLLLVSRIQKGLVCSIAFLECISCIIIASIYIFPVHDIT